MNRLGDNTPALLKSPLEQNLLGSLALLLGNLQDGRILEQWRVCGTEARVASQMDAFLVVVCNELRRGVVGVEL